jgi:hypothetical protein
VGGHAVAGGRRGGKLRSIRLCAAILVTPLGALWEPGYHTMKMRTACNSSLATAFPVNPQCGVGALVPIHVRPALYMLAFSPGQESPTHPCALMFLPW